MNYNPHAEYFLTKPHCLYCRCCPNTTFLNSSFPTTARNNTSIELAGLWVIPENHAVLQLCFESIVLGVLLKKETLRLQYFSECKILAKDWHALRQSSWCIHPWFVQLPLEHVVCFDFCMNQTDVRFSPRLLWMSAACHPPPTGQPTKVSGPENVTQFSCLLTLFV